MGPEIAAILARLDRNDLPQDILDEIDALAPGLGGTGLALMAKGIALNRQGQARAALVELTAAHAALQEEPAHAARAAQQIGIVWYWRGDPAQAQRWFALAVARALEAGEMSVAAAATIDAGRAMLESGNNAAAAHLLRSGLAFGASSLDPIQTLRAKIGLLQAHTRNRDAAAADALLRDLSQAVLTPRFAFLRDLELVRLGRLSIANVKEGHKFDEGMFENVEIAQVAAESCLASGDAEAALQEIAPVLERYAADDLAAREIDALLLKARALQTLNRREAAQAALSSALRRAMLRSLTDHADRVREAMFVMGEMSGGLAGAGGGEGAPSRVDTRFVRHGALAQGRRGAIFRAVDLETGAEVALKQLRLAAEFDGAARTRIVDAAQREALAAARIVHPSVARCHGLYLEPGGDLFIASELVEGPTLRAAMAGRSARAHWRPIVSRLAQALAAFHDAGLVFCDLKPENVVMRAEDWPVLIDFDAIARTGARPVAYTAGYAAPEQIAGEPIDHRADIYALGVVAYELIIGELPAQASGGLQLERKLANSKLELSKAARSMIVLALDPVPARRLNQLQAVTESLVG